MTSQAPQRVDAVAPASAQTVAINATLQLWRQGIAANDPGVDCTGAGRTSLIAHSRGFREGSVLVVTPRIAFYSELTVQSRRITSAEGIPQGV